MFHSGFMMLVPVMFSHTRLVYLGLFAVFGVTHDCGLHPGMTRTIHLDLSGTALTFLAPRLDGKSWCPAVETLLSVQLPTTMQ